MTKEREPDVSEKRLRFGCGFVFGALVAFLALLNYTFDHAGAFRAAVILSALASAYLAV